MLASREVSIEVLEHLADPVQALRQLREKLVPESRLIVEVPNVEARYHGPSRQFHLAHLHVFSEDGLIAAGAQAGLTVKSQMLQPHTRHINVVFAKSDEQHDVGADRTETAGRIEHALRTFTKSADALSARPYRRMWANAKRPIAERLALASLGQPQRPKDILDRLYEKRMGAPGVS